MDRSNFKEAFYNLSTGTPTYAHIVSVIEGKLVKLISQRKRLPNATEDGHHHVQRIKVDIDGVNLFNKQKTLTDEEAKDALKQIIKVFDKPAVDSKKCENQKENETVEDKDQISKPKYTYPELTIDQVVDLVYVSLTGYSVSNFEGFVSYHYVKVHTYTYLPNPVQRDVTEPVVEVKVDGYPLFTVVGYVPEDVVKQYADILRGKLNEKQED
ncbi:MAG: hypothetical protein ACI4UM_08050 [Succinivibrio sp.]